MNYSWQAVFRNSTRPWARLIACEQSGRWAAALRLELAQTGIRVWETRILDDCWDELSNSPGSFLVLELKSTNQKAILQFLTRKNRNFPLAKAVVVADRALAEYRWLMYEAGAAYFTCSIRKMNVVARLACRHLADTPTPSQDLTARIWHSLPWSNR